MLKQTIKTVEEIVKGYKKTVRVSPLCVNANGMMMYDGIDSNNLYVAIKGRLHVLERNREIGDALGDDVRVQIIPMAIARAERIPS